MCHLVPYTSYQSFFDFYVAIRLFLVIVGLYIKNEKMNIFVFFNACCFFLIISDNFSIIADLIFWGPSLIISGLQLFYLWLYGWSVFYVFFSFSK